MYEEISYEDILARMLEQVPDSIDKREGSIMMNALAPAALELSRAYREMDQVILESYANTQSRGYLILRAAERGIYPKLPTAAERRAEFDAEVPMGSRFAAQSVTFMVTERLRDGGYRLLAEEPGSAGNISGVQLVPIDAIEGLGQALLTDILVPGQDEESTESLRQRYFAHVDAQAFGGNTADYREKVSRMAGVGGAKVLPVWNGPGTVKVLVLSAQYSTPSAELVREVQQALDPSGDGKGLGLAPIGHICTVAGVGGLIVNVSTTLTIEEDCDQAEAKEQLAGAIDQYFADLAQEWGASEQLTVRIARLETRILEIAGIVDIASTRLNGVAGNLLLKPEQIPIRGGLNAAFA